PFTYCVNNSDPPVVAPLSTSSTSTPIEFTGCWVTKSTLFDQSHENATVSDVNPRLYFVFRFNHLAAGMSISEWLDGPNGTRHFLDSGPLEITNAGSTYF